MSSDLPLAGQVIAPLGAVEPPHDGTDASARPVYPAERRVLGLAASTWPGILAPLAIGILMLAGWEAVVRIREIPPYILPGPLLVAQTLVADWPTLAGSLLVTLRITLAALVAAVTVGVALAILFTQSILGLNSADHNLVTLFQLYRAGRWQTLRHLRLPAALPYFLGGLKISGGLALIGAVVAEFVAGTGGSASGLAYRILESGYQLRIPRMFAALFLISASGIAIFVLTSWIAHLLLRRWHESAVRREL
jgi:NitT/TauT family transport system permease protein